MVMRQVTKFKFYHKDEHQPTLEKVFFEMKLKNKELKNVNFSDINEPEVGYTFNKKTFWLLPNKEGYRVQWEGKCNWDEGL